MTPPLRISIAGLGTVGASVAAQLLGRADALAARAGRPLRLVAVSARDPSRDRGVDLAGVRWFEDAEAMAREAPADVVVELVGGAEGVARRTVEAALSAGRNVVTANKALIAHHGADLATRAETAGVSLAFEAAVAGGIPVIKALRESLAANEVTRVTGILNGTCNFILTRMEEAGAPFAEALAEAQALGYAEADPTFDVGGFDAAHKIAILAALAFGTAVDADGVSVEGIASIAPLDLAMAAELGYRIKLLGVATRTPAGIEQRVHPTMVPLAHPIAQVMGVLNAVTVNAEPVRELTLVGPGAGAGPTASSVLSDLVDLARGANGPSFGRPAAELAPPVRAPMQSHQGGYYIRLSVLDRPGAAAAIATRMAERNISLESIVQKRRRGAGPLADEAARGEPGPVPVVLVTYATTEASVRDALDAVSKDGHIAAAPQVIRIERA